MLKWQKCTDKSTQDQNNKILHALICNVQHKQIWNFVWNANKCHTNNGVYSDTIVAVSWKFLEKRHELNLLKLDNGETHEPKNQEDYATLLAYFEVVFEQISCLLSMF